MLSLLLGEHFRGIPVGIHGIESRTGTIKVGLEADLVAFDGDPLADAATLFDPRLVITNGVIALEGLGL